MDDETAEIELLEQNLIKTRQISQRMNTILTSFDARLTKLEKSILPLYNSTQILNRRASNIEKTLMKIDEVASSQEGIAAEEALILRGPQPGQLATYREVIERLNGSIAFKVGDQDSLDTARLVETGTKKLTGLYTKQVAEGSSGAAPPPSTLDVQMTFPPFPSSLLSALTPLVDFLRTLPQPATHPSHPAAQAILSTLKDAQRGYADMRGTWSRKCLEGQGKRILDRAETVDVSVAGKEFRAWLDGMLNIAEDEYELLLKLAPLTAPQVIAGTYNNLLKPVMTVFNDTVTSFVAFIKRSLHKNTFLALLSLDSLYSIQSRWDLLLQRRSGGGGKENNELKDSVTTLKGVCMRSFPEFLADIKLAAMSKTGEMNVGLADFTTSTVRYLEKLPDVQSAVGDALLTLGDGNWKMGEGVQVGKSSKDEGNEELIIEHFISDVISTTITSLITLSRTGRRPAWGSIFLLNNISYLVKQILEEPSNPNLAPFISRPAQSLLNSNYRTAKAGYFDSNFTPLMQALTDDPKDKGSGKQAAKEKMTRFFDLLEETKERHKIARVLEYDEEGRMTVMEDVVKLVVPSFLRYTQKQKEKGFSKDPAKYIKMAPDEVESQIKGFYR